MSLLREENLELSSEDYEEVRRILMSTSDTIHHFNECKPHQFNLRRFIEYMVTQDVMEDETDEEFDNPNIERFYDGHVSAFLNAFFSFTPFIKSEIILRILAFLASTVARIGIEGIKKSASEWAEVFSWVKKEAEHRNLLYN